MVLNARMLTLLVLCGAWRSGAQPVIADQGVTNAASYSILQASGGGIAPGSIVVIFGTGLGPDSLQAANGYPLRTELAGTSVRLGGSSAYMLYTSAVQVAAIAPSTLQPGMHQLTVAFGNRTSQPVTVPVIQTDFGIFTRNSAGYGQAAAQTVLPDGAVQTLGLASSVRPGEPIVLYGTGLGGIAGAPDDQPPGVRPTTTAVEVIIGGKVVTPQYAGRSPNFAGLDQVNFTAPADLGPDCYVSLGVRANGRLSNVVSVPVTQTGRSCAHPFQLSETAMQRIDSGQAIVIVQALMERRSSESGSAGEGAGIGFAEVDANALEITAAPTADPYETTSAGTCAVLVNDSTTTVISRPSVRGPRFLDAGASVRLEGPSHSTDLLR
ncbi:MAG: hypothetical protein ACRD7E_30220, partial [Bryobacteraceae bacterium]